MPDFYLIAHSHGVSLLDGITDWRSEWRPKCEQDGRYGAPFQGWFDGSVTGAPFRCRIVDGELPALQVEAWCISAGSGVGDLVRPSAEQGGRGFEIDSRFGALMASWDGASPIVSMLHGNEHAMTMLNTMPPYDFIDADVPVVQPGVPIIDDLFINGRVDSWIAAVYRPLSAMRQLVGNPLVHILPPPPREHPEASSHFEVLGDLVDAYGFTPGHLRLKWYRRYCRRLAEVLGGLGFHVLKAPAEACNEAGLLTAEHAEGLTHGNARYGRLVGKRLSSLLEELA